MCAQSTQQQSMVLMFVKYLERWEKMEISGDYCTQLKMMEIYFRFFFYSLNAMILIYSDYLSSQLNFFSSLC